MQPEDIDKLFRDKLAQHAPTPPAYLWNQLEDELQPTKKRPVLWMWAAAASVILLLVSGVLWMQNSGLRPASSGTVATAGRPAQSSQRASINEPATELENKKAVAAIPQATTPPPAASSPSEAAASPASSNRPQQAPATSTRQLATSVPCPRVAAPVTRPVDQPAQEVVAVQVPSPQPERPLEPIAPTSQKTPVPIPALALAATPAPAGAIEVEVRRSTAPAVATAAPANARQRSLGGVLLRQARNAVRGERLSLAEAGLPETVTVQAHVAGRTLTKVIQL